MSLILCETSPGLRDSEIIATVRDITGRRHYIRVERDFLTQRIGKDYLPIGIVHIDPKTQAVLIEFSHEPDSGYNRIWINQNQLDQPVEAYA